VDHPYVVKLHYAFQSPEKLYFVLDWINGGELYFHLKKDGIFSEARVRVYGAELALAISHLHSQRIMYRYELTIFNMSWIYLTSKSDIRDLKLENVLLDQDGRYRCFFAQL
jgi:serine/threonine protein kinase